MNVSVIICTYNRCRSLETALESLSASVMPDSTQWEVVVADNNSSDDTRRVAEGFCRRDPARFRYLFEPTQGKSYALNTAVRESRGEILAFTDDDVIFDPNWLSNLTGTLAGGEYGGAAGRILPSQSLDPPRWLALEGKYNLIGVVCPYFEPGKTAHDLKEPPFGANMAFRREMFSKYGEFRVDLGPSSKSRVLGEDTEFARRLMSRGERIRYTPSATVYHEIHQDRINKDYFLYWWNGLGKGSVRESSRNLSAGQAFKILGRGLVTALEGLVSFNPQRRFYCKCRVWFSAGKLTEAFQRAWNISR